MAGGKAAAEARAVTAVAVRCSAWLGVAAFGSCVMACSVQKLPSRIERRAACQIVGRNSPGLAHDVRAVAKYVNTDAPTEFLERVSGAVGEKQKAVPERFGVAHDEFVFDSVRVWSAVRFSLLDGLQ